MTCRREDEEGTVAKTNYVLRTGNFRHDRITRHEFDPQNTNSGQDISGSGRFRVDPKLTRKNRVIFGSGSGNPKSTRIYLLYNILNKVYT